MLEQPHLQGNNADKVRDFSVCACRELIVLTLPVHVLDVNIMLAIRQVTPECY
jgi:hypothetical protein